MTIKQFHIEYDAINRKNIFSNGDTINGRIIVKVSSQTKIQSLTFIAKGKAFVSWEERSGENVRRVFADKEIYYEIEHPILKEGRRGGSEVIGKGENVFPFAFKIPDSEFPSSFKGRCGKIVYKLKAELKQSMKPTKKAHAYFTFVSKACIDIPGLMDPQHDSQTTAIKVFGSGNVTLEVHTQKMGYKQGDAVEVTAVIRNTSNRAVKPKYILYERNTFSAGNARNHGIRKVLTEYGDKLHASSGQDTITKVITIPRELTPSIFKCSFIQLEYKLMISLDIKCAKNPVVMLPIVVQPRF